MLGLGAGAIIGEVKLVTTVSDALRDDCYYIANHFNPSQADKIYNLMQKDVNEKKHTMFTFENSGFVYGFIKANPFCSVGMVEIDWLYIDKKYTRNSIGSQLLNACIFYAKQNNVNEIRLYSQTSERAWNFYNKHGFEVIGPLLLMGKKLK